MLSGGNKHIREQLDVTEITEELLDEENIFMVTDILVESARAAYIAAQAWLKGLEPDQDRGGSPDQGDAKT